MCSVWRERSFADVPVCLTGSRDMDTRRTHSSELERIHEKTGWASAVGRAWRRLMTWPMKLWPFKAKKRWRETIYGVDEWTEDLSEVMNRLHELFSQKCCLSGASTISPFSLVAFSPSSWPRPSSTAPVRMFPLITSQTLKSFCFFSSAPCCFF